MRGVCDAVIVFGVWGRSGNGDLDFVSALESGLL